jgi:hypothetical protein
MIEIRQLNKKALQAYIDSQEYKTAPHIAISYHRAISHIQNPCADEDDVLLFVAYDGLQMAGYLGALPDDLYDGYGMKHHFAWMSCLWIDPAQRGKNIAASLVKTCFTAWNNRILLTEYTGPAASLYYKLGIFSELPQLNGRRWYLQSDLARILSPKSKYFNKIKPLLTTFDTLCNTLLRMGNICKNQVNNLNEVKEITDELAQFIQKSTSNLCFLTKSNSIQWMMQYPWLMQSKLTVDSVRYYFSSVADQFVSKAFIIQNDKNQIAGFMLIMVRDGHLKIPILHYDCSIEEVAKVVKSIVRQYQVKTFTLYHPELIHHLQSKNVFFSFSKAIVRKYLISTVFWAELDHIAVPLSDGDGDTAFT